MFGDLIFKFICVCPALRPPRKASTGILRNYVCASAEHGQNVLFHLWKKVLVNESDERIASVRLLPQRWCLLSLTKRTKNLVSIQPETQLIAHTPPAIYIP